MQKNHLSSRGQSIIFGTASALLLLAQSSLSCVLPVTAVPQQQQPSPSASKRINANTRAYMGVFLGNAKDTTGALIGKVIESSPAAKAGLIAHDVIVKFDDALIESATQVFRLLNETAPQKIVTLQVLRKNELISIPVTLGEYAGNSEDPCKKIFREADAIDMEVEQLRKQAESARQKGDEATAKAQEALADQAAAQAKITRASIQEALDTGKVAAPTAEDGAASLRCEPLGAPARQLNFGLTLLPLSDQLAVSLNTAINSLLIAEIKANSLAMQSGLRVGDCIVNVNGKNITSTADFNRQLLLIRDTKANGQAASVMLAITRDRKPVILQLNLPN